MVGPGALVWARPAVQRVHDFVQSLKRISQLLLAPRSLLFVAQFALTCLITVGANAAEPLTFLRARGQDIVNEHGEKVMLRGVGLGNWMLPEGYMWKFGTNGDRPRRIEKLVGELIGPEDANRFWSEFRQHYINETDIQRIAALGYNSVRPALNSRLFLTETTPPTRVEEGFTLLDNLVQWCKANRIYVIIDLHGAPGGQTGQNIDDSANDLPELFMQSKYQDQVVELWTTLARRYKDEPTVAGYDLLNEPLPARTGAAAKHKDQLEPLYQRITKAIRAVDSKHLIILEGMDWANDWSIFTRPFDSNLVYQFHYYCWDTPAKVKSIDRYLEYRKRFNAPVWVGETGERDNAIYWATTEYFEANNIGWAFWPWKKMDTENTPFSINRPTQWDTVVAYSNGGVAPPRDIAKKTFDELLANIRLTNCVYHPDVVNAMLRRAPVRVEAENFGHDGSQASYFVKDSRPATEFYRQSERVPIKAEPAERPRASSQFITLTESEWTAYKLGRETPGQYEITVRVRTQSTLSEALLSVNHRLLSLKITDKAWTEIKLGPVQLDPSANHLKWIIKRGTVDLDWIDIKRVTTHLPATSAATGG